MPAPYPGDQSRGEDVETRLTAGIAVPACMGGSQDDTLALTLLRSEGPIGHSLLSKFAPGKPGIEYASSALTGVPPMASFTLFKIRATVETGAMLLPEDQVDKTLEELRGNLKGLGLAVLSIDRTNVAQAQSEEPLDAKDPWSFRGQGRD